MSEQKCKVCAGSGEMKQFTSAGAPQPIVPCFACNGSGSWCPTPEGCAPHGCHGACLPDDAMTTTHEADRLAEQIKADVSRCGLYLPTVNTAADALAALAKQQAHEAPAEPVKDGEYRLTVEEQNVLRRALLKGVRIIDDSAQKDRAWEYRLAQSKDETSRERTYRANFELDLHRALNGEATICNFELVEEVRTALAAQDTQKAEATQAAENPTPCPWHSRYMPDCQFCRHASPAQSPEQPSQAEPMSDETIERMVLNRPDMAQAIHFDIIPMGAFVDLGRAILAEAGIKDKT